MGVDTNGKIKGFVRHEEILNFIRQKYDKNVSCNIERNSHKSLSDITWDYKLNEHSDSNTEWYCISGFIYFNYKGEARSLFYMYDNIYHLESNEYYEEHDLSELINAETTYLSLGCWGASVDIIKEIIENFGGGWLDENDCDDTPYYKVAYNKDETISPVVYVTMSEIREKFGENVVIVD